MRKIALMPVILILFGSMLVLQGCATGITYVSKEKDVQTGADLYVVRDAVTGIAYNVTPAAPTQELTPLKNGQELLLRDRIIGQPVVYNGKKLCLVRVNSAGALDLFIMDEDGSNLKRLTFLNMKNLVSQKFIFNGTRILFEQSLGQYNEGRQAYFPSNICIINTDGSDMKIFTSSYLGYKLSPDDNGLAYPLRANNLWSIYVLNNDLVPHKIFETKDKREVMFLQKWTSEGIFFQVAPNFNSSKWKWLVINPDGSNLMEVSHEYFLSAK